MKKNCFKSNNVSGLSMVEVMVSIVLLAISMLGLAAMQNNSSRIDYQAHLRTQAVAQVVDMVDRMRTNIAGVDGGFYIPDPIPITYGADDCGNVGNTCTPQQLATYDWVVWNETNAARLPGGIGSIETVGDVADRIFEVAVIWQEQHSGEDVTGYESNCDGSANEAIQCYQLIVRM